MDSTRKRTTRYDKIVERQDDRQIERHKPNNPALHGGVATIEQTRRAEIATRTSERIQILMSSGRFDACFELLADAQAEMAPGAFRPSSPVVDVLGLRISNLLEERFGVETLLQAAIFSEAEYLEVKQMGPGKVAALRAALKMVGLAMKGEKLD